MAPSPAAFLVEAADDICYRILDLEDAATVGDLADAEVSELLEQITGKPNRGRDAGQTQADYIGMLRAMAIGASIDAAVSAFLAHYDDIMAGRFNDGLMEVSSKADAYTRLERHLQCADFHRAAQDRAGNRRPSGAAPDP